MLPAPLYKKMGIDTHHLTLILTTKLIMDDRRPNTFHQTSQKKPGTVSLATLGTMLFSTLLGLFLILCFELSNPILQLTLYFLFFIFMLGLTLIADFTSVLIDIRDNIIIFSKPVTGKTFILSRLIHIFIHITKIAFPMALPSLVYMAIFRNPWAAAVLLLLVVSATIFTIFLINIVYLIILKITSPRKFQSIISYVQIGMTIFFYGSFQIGPRLASKINLDNLKIIDTAWMWLLPPYWYAKGFLFFSYFQIQISSITGAILITLAPVFALWLVIKYFAPSFNQKLSLVAAGSAETVISKKSNYGFWSSVSRFFARMFTKPGEERVGFMLTWNLTSRERDFKLKVYPATGYILVLVVVMFLNHSKSVFALQRQPENIRTILLPILYSSSLLLVVAISQFQYSDKFKAAWFYFTAPVGRPGLILTGALKSAIVKFFLPIALIIAIPALLFISTGLLPNILLSISNVLIGSIILSLITLRHLPFSVPQSTGTKTGAQLRNLMSMLIMIFLGILHYLIYNFKWVVIIFCCLSLLANWFVLDYLKNKSWKQVLAQYNEE